MKKIFYLLIILTLAACASEPPLPTLAPTLISSSKPTDSPKPASTTVPPTTVFQPTTLPTASTNAPQPTSAQPTVVAPLKGELILWHAYEVDSVEEKTFLQVIDSVKKKNPELKLSVQRVAAYDAATLYTASAKVGGIPDLLITSNDSLGEMVRGKSVLDITPYLNNKLASVAPYAIEAMKVDGKIYGVPESANTVVLYYNKTLLDKAPATTDELLNLVKSNKSLVAVSGAYHLFGFFSAFGGKLFDDGGKCVADNGGFAEAMQYLFELKKSGAILESGDSALATSFLDGKTAMFINTTWALNEYKQTLGDKLFVAPLPAGAKGKATPLTVVDGFFVNPNSKNPQLAVSVALLLTNQESSQLLTDAASHIPVRVDIKTDVAMTILSRATSEGTLYPQGKEFNNYWQPFGEVFVRVLDLKTPPADAVKQACTAMNKANGK